MTAVGRSRAPTDIESLPESHSRGSTPADPVQNRDLNREEPLPPRRITQCTCKTVRDVALVVFFMCAVGGFAFAFKTYSNNKTLAVTYVCGMTLFGGIALWRMCHLYRRKGTPDCFCYE